MIFEFYIYSKDGDDVWHRDLNQPDKVINDIKDNKNDETFSVEVLAWLSENNCEHIDIYPIDNSSCLPRYVQKEVNKILGVTS